MNHFIITLNPYQYQIQLFENHINMVKQVNEKLKEIANEQLVHGHRLLSTFELYRIIKSLRYQNPILKAAAAKSYNSLARNFESYSNIPPDDSFPMEIPTGGIKISPFSVRLGRRYGDIPTAFRTSSINGYIKQAFIRKYKDNWILELYVETVCSTDFVNCIINPDDIDD